MSTVDPRLLSFSRAHGYEALPQQLKLEELSGDARVRLWNVLVSPSIDRFGHYTHPWQEIFSYIYSHFLSMPMTSEVIEYADVQRLFDRPIQDFIQNEPFNRVFDLLLAVMRHKECPRATIAQISEVFQNCKLAYLVDEGPPPAIYPSTTPEEGTNIIDSLSHLRSAGLTAPRQHLQMASSHINQKDWAGAVRESIHSVESVARLIAPKAKTLGEALSVLGKKGLLEYKALREGFNRIYGYTNDEQGIRHALLDDDKSNVGQEEAVFMLGACASFASYLSRKQLAIANQDSGRCRLKCRSPVNLKGKD